MSIMIVKFQGDSQRIKNPNVCPHCHVSNHPNDLWQSTYKADDSTELITAHRCANDECSKIIIPLYTLNERNKFIFSRCLNGQIKETEWPEPIKNLQDGKTVYEEKPSKSKFTKTYSQSLEAEMNGLDELAGMGFRKSIEYLIKDWAIQNNPDDSEKIEDLWLGQVIKEYYESDLKEILERATWLGNDQSHYKKLFEEYDIEVLKELISFIAVELDRQYKMNHYINSIQKRK